MPQRIQRRRTKGWRMPEGAVYVGRPTRWGNPYAEKWFSRFAGFDVALAIALFRNTATGYWNPTVVAHLPDHVVKIVYSVHHRWLSKAHLGDLRYELRGKDLACWCPLDQPCHADVLLELANREREDPVARITTGDGDA